MGEGVMFAFFANIMTEPYPILRAHTYPIQTRAARRLAARPTSSASEARLVL